MTFIKILAVVTAISFVAGCDAEPRGKAPPQGSPTSEAVRDPVEPPAPDAKITDRNGSQASTLSGTAVLAVEGGGIRFFNPATTAATLIQFGRPRLEVLAKVERVRGLAGKGTNENCGAEPVQYATWPDGLSLVFQRNRFVGWGLDERAEGAISTVGNIGPGSTREALDGTYGNVEISKTTLGDEFSAGEFFGLLDGPNAASKITHMWAGVNCVAR